MTVRIKDFAVEMEVRTNGVEFEVRTKDGVSQVGDCYVTKTGLTWCLGRTTKTNGVSLTWKQLETILASNDAKDAALKAARRT